MRVGLTGGIGSGKSEVARIFSQLGAYVIDTDVLAREAVQKGSEAVTKIQSRWPSVVQHGEIDRAALAEIVLGDPRAREKLNSIIHPVVRKLAMEREKLAEPGQLIIHVVPLLFETGYVDSVQKSVLVTAPLERRIWRVVNRDNVYDKKVRRRIAAQIDPEIARERADFVIENDGDFQQLRESTRNVFEKLGTQ